jgi:hypothetical protein
MSRTRACGCSWVGLDALLVIALGGAVVLL